MDKFNIYGLDKKLISKLIVDEKNEFLLNGPNTIEWYLTILSCHNFIKLPILKVWNRDTCKCDLIEPDESRKTNFEQVKKLLKEKKKNSK